MFEVGKAYQLTLYSEGPDRGASVYYGCRVTQIDGTVVKFEQTGKEMIVNTASPLFGMAEPDED